MALLPKANVSLDSVAGAFAGGTGFLVVMACVGQNADLTPRVFTSTDAMLAQHAYAPGVDFSAIHLDEAALPVVFVGLPIAVAGTIGRVNNTGVTGTSAITVTAAASGVLEEVSAVLTVVNPGTVGSEGITINVSMDGGWTNVLARLGTQTSYTVPFVGLVINFGAGTLNFGDTLTFATTAPLWDNAGLTSAFAALTAQQKQARSVLIVGDVADATHAGYVTTQANAYASAAARFTYARINVRDRVASASKSQFQKRMLGSGQTLTFAAAGETITRSAGSFVADGFAVGDVISITGSSSNNVTERVTAVTPTVLTVNTGLANEGPVGGVTITGSEGLAFDGTAHTVTRSTGGWLNDGFAVGDSVTFAGTTSNNTTQTVTALTNTVMTFAAGLVTETDASYAVTASKGETMPGWVSTMDSAFASVDAQNRIDIALGRARKVSPITGWNFRRPASWAATTREYEHDVQIPCWRKTDGPLSGWSLLDTKGNVVEYDERTIGGALAARFTCMRSFGNGPEGAFIALSLTRATEGSLLSRTHNMAVACLAETIIQAETENAIGQVLQLNANGTGTEASLCQVEERVNTALHVNLMQELKEGQRASSCTWKASRSDVLSQVGATLTGIAKLELNDALEQIATSVVVQQAA